MQVGNIEITKEMMPSYQIGAEYPTRQYQFMQDTLSNALTNAAQIQTAAQPNGVGVARNSAETNNVWQGKQQ